MTPTFPVRVKECCLILFFLAYGKLNFTVESVSTASRSAFWHANLHDVAIRIVWLRGFTGRLILPLRPPPCFLRMCHFAACELWHSATREEGQGGNEPDWHCQTASTISALNATQKSS